MDIRWAIILAVGFLLAGFVHGGVYAVTGAGEGHAYRVNKFTGAMDRCGGIRCRPLTWPLE